MKELRAKGQRALRNIIIVTCWGELQNFTRFQDFLFDTTIVRMQKKIGYGQNIDHTVANVDARFSFDSQ